MCTVAKDRIFRVYDFKAEEELHHIYLKSQLTSVLLLENLQTEISNENELDLNESLNDDNKSNNSIEEPELDENDDIDWNKFEINQEFDDDDDDEYDDDEELDDNNKFNKKKKKKGDKINYNKENLKRKTKKRKENNYDNDFIEIDPKRKKR